MQYTGIYIKDLRRANFLLLLSGVSILMTSIYIYTEHLAFQADLTEAYTRDLYTSSEPYRAHDQVVASSLAASSTAATTDTQR